MRKGTASPYPAALQWSEGVAAESRPCACTPAAHSPQQHWQHPLLCQLRLDAVAVGQLTQCGCSTPHQLRGPRLGCCRQQLQQRGHTTCLCKGLADLVIGSNLRSCYVARDQQVAVTRQPATDEGQHVQLVVGVCEWCGVHCCEVCCAVLYRQLSPRLNQAQTSSTSRTACHLPASQLP